MPYVNDSLDDRPIEEVARTHYEFPVPYIHYTEDDWPPQRIVVYPVEGRGYCVQYEYDGEPMASKGHAHLSGALVTARHLMGICCVQGDPNKIRSYLLSL